MAHPIYNASFCKLGHKIIAGLIDESVHNRCTKEEVAVAMNAALNLDPKKDFAALTEQDIEAAVRSGAFDTATRAFGDFRGRYGGLRDAAVPEPAPKAKAKGKGRKAEAAPEETAA